MFLQLKMCFSCRNCYRKAFCKHIRQIFLETLALVSIINKVPCQVFSFKLPTNFSYELSGKPFQWKPMINSFCFVVNKLNKRSQTTRTFFQWLMQSLLLCGYKSFNIIALLLKEGGQWIFTFEFKRSFTPKTIISCIAILIKDDH